MTGGRFQGQAAFEDGLRTDKASTFFPSAAFRHLQIISSLQIQPEFGARSKHLAKPNRAQRTL
jgi:hypothetical protein